MGIAKSIESYGIYRFYSPDTDVFLSTLSELISANFKVSLMDDECNLVYENKLFDFGYTISLKVYIDQWEYNIQNEKQTLPTYSVQFPINYEHETELEIEFYPNQVCLMYFLTFEHLWSSFIRVLRFEINWPDVPRKQIIERYNILRKEYSLILNKLGINSIFILTVANYNIEDISNPVSFFHPEFEDIISNAKTVDGLNTFYLEELLLAKRREQLPEEFLNLNELKIAFVDNLKELI